jgi:hypothetical protein
MLTVLTILGAIGLILLALTILFWFLGTADLLTHIFCGRAVFELVGGLIELAIEAICSIGGGSD